ncbi:MAG: hypothetical protein RL508_55 [Actinomycetota bacterium]|jgi:uncharacterized membrane protein YfcA
MTLPIFLFLMLAGIAAGISGAVAGLASIFSFPALLLIGVSPVSANVTNSISLSAMSFSSIHASYPEWRSHKQILKRLAPSMLIGGTIGAILLLQTPGASFQKIASVLIALASFAILIPKRTATHEAPKRLWPLMLIMLLVGIYCGYFGAGAGTITMAATMLILGVDLKVGSALKNVLLFLANTMGVLIFLFSGQVNWLMAIPLALGFAIGGRLGPNIVRRANPVILRWVVSGFGLCVATWMMLK